MELNNQQQTINHMKKVKTGNVRKSKVKKVW